MKLLTRRLRRRTPQPTLSAAETSELHYLREFVLPSPANSHDQYVPSRWIGSHGIDLDESEQLARLERWRGDTYQELYLRLRNDDKVNCPLNGVSYLGSTCLHNGWYPTPDAEIYASMIYDFRPDKVVEVGSGFSTLIARRTMTHAGIDAPLVVIDPLPRTDVTEAADRVILKRVEDAKVETLELTGRSILFIDSSHVTRPRGDVPYLYCEVLPQLPAGMVVHLHDIFIPYDYPTNYDHLCWTEQYVLQTLLAHSPRYHTLLSTHYMTRHHATEMQATFGPQVGADNLFYGASYWIQIH